MNFIILIFKKKKKKKQVMSVEDLSHLSMITPFGIILTLLFKFLSQ